MMTIRFREPQRAGQSDDDLAHELAEVELSHSAGTVPAVLILLTLLVPFA